MKRSDEKAVALAFDPNAPDVPKIVATGQGELARQILDIAFAQGIKVREDPDLLEILSILDEGAEIPVIAFAAVAEILSHVYRWEMQHAPDGSSGPITPEMFTPEIFAPETGR